MTDITRKRLPPRTTYSRKPTSTTSKRRLPPDSPPTKRPRPSNDPPSSSPPRSSPAPETSEIEIEDKADTLLSSPPRAPPPPKKPPFTFFTRASTTSSRRRTTTITVPTSRKQKLTQLTIDLGQSLRTTCRTCGMSYHPSTPDDEALHKRFHAKSVGGVDFGLKTSSDRRKRVDGAGDTEAYILIVDRKASPGEKRKAREVLEVVDSELGAAEIEEGVLWEGGGEERFKVFLYVVGKKCVGLLLAERIKRAYRVLDEPGEGSSSVSIGESSWPAILGVSRIWTCKSHRRQGVAGRLLDCARGAFVYGMEVEKGMVAFSQPTESGGGLARGWFGGGEWKVYVEDL